MIDQLGRLASTQGTLNGQLTAALRHHHADGSRAEAAEVAALLERQRLVRSGALTVFWAEASQAPRLLDRISIERELTFRAVGEGTGRDRDRDRFDDRYLHLCAWDHTRHSLVGAYRLALLDSSASVSASSSAPSSDRWRHAGVVPALDMLYTSTLFHFDRRLDALLSPAMELGRAFVRAPYQKHHAALMALWMGIGRLVVTRSRTRYLFGAVSIPASYSVAARAAMIAFLRRHACHERFARLTTPRNPIPAITVGSWTGGSSSACASATASASASSSAAFAAARSLELSGEAIRAAAADVPATLDVDALDNQVRALDREGKGVPVLLRQYLRLGARALAFNVDDAFNKALDVLVVVDLPNAPAALLRRYMGSDDARAYVERHDGLDRAA